MTRVAIAAAGRVLKTREALVKKDIEYGREITHDEVESLEIEGVQMAQKALEVDLPDSEKSLYYCVGYTVMGYYLNNYLITSLEEHKGNNIGADVLATFLSHSIVDSLYTVMKKIDLDVINLTLEPIAAINIAIPEDIRLLNIALVDIGAGTSDIAISKDGTIVAYDMAPVAGDEITEAICQSYLVDFNTAEKIKLNLCECDNIKYTDIIGIEHDIKSEDVIQKIKPCVENLANVITQKILKCNKKSPSAVFLVGGGSQIVGLRDDISQKLGLPVERISIRNRSSIKNVLMDDVKFKGPDIITPIGIAITALYETGKNFVSVIVNNKKIKLFNNNKLVVLDALIAANFESSKLIAKNGKDLAYTVNGEKKIKQGELGKQCEIYINDVSANLRTKIKNNDSIKIIPSVNGTDAEAYLSDEVNFDAYDAYVNGVKAAENCRIKNDDIIEYTIKEKLQTVEEEKNIENESKVDDEQKSKKVENDKDSIFVMVNDTLVEIPGKNKKHIFVDIFNYYDFDTSNLKGSIALTLNGSNAAYTDSIHDGDEIKFIVSKNITSTNIYIESIKIIRVGTGIMKSIVIELIMSVSLCYALMISVKLMISSEQLKRFSQTASQNLNHQFHVF